MGPAQPLGPLGLRFAIPPTMRRYTVQKSKVPSHSSPHFQQIRHLRTRTGQIPQSSGCRNLGPKQTAQNHHPKMCFGHMRTAPVLVLASGRRPEEMLAEVLVGGSAAVQVEEPVCCFQMGSAEELALVSGLAPLLRFGLARCSPARTVSNEDSKTCNTKQLGNMSPQPSPSLRIAHMHPHMFQKPAGGLAPELVLESALQSVPKRAPQRSAELAGCSPARIVRERDSKTCNTNQLGSTSHLSSPNPRIARTNLRMCRKPAGGSAPELKLGSVQGLAPVLAVGWAEEMLRQQAWEQAMAMAQCQEHQKLHPRLRKTERSRPCSCRPTATAASRVRLAYRPGLHGLGKVLAALAMLVACGRGAAPVIVHVDPIREGVIQEALLVLSL